MNTVVDNSQLINYTTTNQGQVQVVRHVQPQQQQVTGGQNRQGQIIMNNQMVQVIFIFFSTDNNLGILKGEPKKMRTFLKLKLRGLC